MNFSSRPEQLSHQKLLFSTPPLIEIFTITGFDGIVSSPLPSCGRQVSGERELEDAIPDAFDHFDFLWLAAVSNIGLLEGE